MDTIWEHKCFEQLPSNSDRQIYNKVVRLVRLLNGC